eukprot:m.256723 g.256723  ORF g.256723 m.256723 type:complete len:66 (-) comp15524_c0_seq13:927-1124(-)
MIQSAPLNALCKDLRRCAHVIQCNLYGGDAFAVIGNGGVNEFLAKLLMGGDVLIITQQVCRSFSP